MASDIIAILRSTKNVPNNAQALAMRMPVMVITSAEVI
jgi:hypothetical protein